MVTLGNYLTSLFNTKGLQQMTFYKNAYISKSTFVNYLKDKHIPDINFLDKVITYLELTPEEIGILLGLYESASYGKDILINTQTIHNILENFNMFDNYTTLNQHSKSHLSSYDLLPIELKSFLTNILLQINTSSTTKFLLKTTQTPEINQLVQYIINKLHITENKDIEIEHIFNYKNIKEQFELTNNLIFLSSISSLIASFENYNPYFHTITYSQENSYDIFPNILLINNNIIYMSDDFKTWFYINQQNNSNINQIVTSFYAEFEKSKKHTKPFIRTMKDTISFQNFIIDIESNSTVEYGLRRDMTCCAPPPNMSIEWFEYDSNSISEDVLKTLIQLHNERTTKFEQKLENKLQCCLVCSVNSTFDFLSTGRIYDQGPYPTFKREIRIAIILNLLKLLRKYPDFNVYFLKNRMIKNLPFIDRVQLCTNDGHLMISISDDNSEICKSQPFLFSILLDSSELANCFNSYIIGLTKTMTYSKEESISIIEKELNDFLLKD